jgi:predicted peptidase
MPQQSLTFEREITKKLRLKYLLYLPGNYNPDEDKKWPLILFLHGAGERGDNLDIVKRTGIPKIVEKNDKFPFISVSPQCPEHSSWEGHFEELDLLLEEIVQSYKVDEDRVYVTGLSMGGYGTWDLAMVFPDRFAAIVPICGGSTYPEAVGVLKNLPIWAFHGSEDDIVPVEESKDLVDALKALDGNVRFTIYRDTGHDSWTQTYENADIYKWMLQQKRNTLL